MTQSAEARSDATTPVQEGGHGDEVGRALRRFARSGARRDDGLTPLGEGWLPALLHRFRDESHLRTPFPYFLPTPSVDGPTEGEPLSTLLVRAATTLELEAGDRKILDDNLDRFERALRDRLEGSTTRSSFVEAAAPVLEEAVQGLSEHVRAALGRAWPALVAAVPRGHLLPFEADVPLELWIHAAEVRARRMRASLVAELGELRRRAQERLLLEADAETSEVRGLGEGGTDLLDPGALARASRKRPGRIGLGPSRRDALQRAVEVIEGFLGGDGSPSLLVVRSGESRSEGAVRGPGHPEADGNVAAAQGAGPLAGEPVGGAVPAGGEPSAGSVWVFSDPDPTARALELILREADAWVEVIQAIRRCELEVEGSFDPARHEAILGSLTREALTTDELAFLAPVLAVENPVRLRGRGLPSLSRVLRSGWPVHVLVPLDPFDDTEPDRHRLELGYVGIGHRRAAVHQGVASEPADLLRAFARLAERHEPSLHLIGVAPREAAPGPWLHLGAAVEGRAHPVFVYDPQTGQSWSERLDFRGNPAGESAWPVYPLGEAIPVEGEAPRELAFTFVDFALLDPSARTHFRLVPEGFDHEDLVPVAAALDQYGAVRTPRVPFVWAVGPAGELARVATTEAMLRSAADRLDYWRTLQELAGVRNAYVDSAVARVSETARLEAEAERARREEAFRREVEQARENAVRDALAGVAGFLLGMGEVPGALALGSPGGVALGPPAPANGETPLAPGPVSAAPSAGSGTAPGSVAEAAPPAAGGAPSPAGSGASVSEDPWVDTILCTSCNDCVQINPRLFVYDANKQVRIGDPEAGSYADLVRAAEKCPARCIHPGTPLDPQEAGLAELVERARAFR